MKKIIVRLKTFQELFRRDRRPGDLVFACLFLAFCLFLLASLPGQAAWSKRTALVAQPAFWPTVSILGMCLFAVLHLIGSVSSPRIPGRLKEFGFWLRSLEFVGYFLVYVAAVPVTGYLPATLAFALLLSVRLGYRNRSHLAVAAGFACAVVLVFRAGLQVKIPAGEVYQHLPDAIRSFAMINL